MDNVPPFLKPLYDNDRELYDLVMSNLQALHGEGGSMPVKYRYLFSLVADGMMNHPHGVAAMAQAARAAGATEEEIREAMRTIFVSGGMVALVNSLSGYEK